MSIHIRKKVNRRGKNSRSLDLTGVLGEVLDVNIGDELEIEVTDTHVIITREPVTAEKSVSLR